jgi:hypothetical protein
VSFPKKEAHLTKTKNGSDRTVYLNADALAVLTAMRRSKAKDPIFPREGKKPDTRSWFPPFDGGGGDHRIRLARKPPYFLFVACDGRGDDEGDPGCRWSQIDHYVGPIQPLVPKHKASVVDKIAGATF